MFDLKSSKRTILKEIVSLTERVDFILNYEDLIDKSNKMICKAMLLLCTNSNILSVRSVLIVYIGR